jgi:hydrogenase expression/formation protein HypC
MQIININYPIGVAEAKGVKRDIGLQLLPEGDIKIGDHVVVHVGFAIEKIDKERSDEIWQGLNELLELMDQEEDSA